MKFISLLLIIIITTQGVVFGFQLNNITDHGIAFGSQILESTKSTGIYVWESTKSTGIYVWESTKSTGIYVWDHGISQLSNTSSTILKSAKPAGIYINKVAGNIWNQLSDTTGTTIRELEAIASDYFSNKTVDTSHIHEKYYPNCTNVVSYNNISRFCLPFFNCSETEHSCQIIDRLGSFNRTDDCHYGNYNVGPFDGECKFCCEDQGANGSAGKTEYFKLIYILLALLSYYSVFIFCRR